MIKRLKVIGLNGRIDLDETFNSDINLLTGKNGAGKTTILKLIWYLNGAYIYNLITEINFDEIELETTISTISVKKTEQKKERGYTYEFKVEPEGRTFNINERNIRELEMRHPSLFGHSNSLRETALPSIFFPTFRRIEGGFSMDNKRNPYGERTAVKDALNELSQRLSFFNQRFITSISTDDLVSLVTSEFARITETFNALQKEQSEKIIKQIRYRNNQNDSELLASVQGEIISLEETRKASFLPFTILGELIVSIFTHKGIRLSNLTIGDIGNAISSDKLSAGEKQMLSFICYNTFTRNHIIFIDEPELSLHPDWQRILLPTLLKQDNSNQFFMATHSPFIYSKYSDKEIIIEQDKGDN